MNDSDMMRCYIGLGSNLENPVQQLKSALNGLALLPECRLGEVSSFYASQPMGPQDQPDYVNAVAELLTVLSPHALLDQMQRLETTHGRVRDGERWGPRTLDLDLLLYAQQRIEDERLTVPHYGMAQRNFVLYPLAQIVGNAFIIPGLGALDRLLLQCPRGDLRELSEQFLVK